MSSILILIIITEVLFPWEMSTYSLLFLTVLNCRSQRFIISSSIIIINNGITENIVRKGNQIYHIRENISTYKAHSFSAGFPIPFAIFSKSIKEIASTNPDKMSFLHFVMAYQHHEIPHHLDKKTCGISTPTDKFYYQKPVRLNVNLYHYSKRKCFFSLLYEPTNKPYS